MGWIKASVIGMGVLLVGGFVIVAVTLLQRMSGQEAAEPGATTIELAAGETLTGADLDGGRLLLQIETASGARVEVRDLASGALRGRIDIVRTESASSADK